MGGAEPVAEYAVGIPRADVRGLVARYVGYRLEGFAPGIHRGLPGRHLTVVVSLAGPVRMRPAGAGSSGEVPPLELDAVAAGLDAAATLIEHDGWQAGVHLDLTPAGARRLLGCPAGDLAGIAVPLDAVLGPAAGELSERLRDGESWANRFAALDAVLGGIARRRDGATRRPPRAEVALAWNRIVTSAGSASVAGIAAEVGWSRRHLTDQFAREVGLPPKVLARVVRFERARRSLAMPGRPSLAAVAARHGYADQAHLAREFRELAGCSPTRWLAEEVFPSVQDSGDEAGAG